MVGAWTHYRSAACKGQASRPWPGHLAVQWELWFCREHRLWMSHWLLEYRSNHRRTAASKAWVISPTTFRQLFSESNWAWAIPWYSTAEQTGACVSAGEGLWTTLTHTSGSSTPFALTWRSTANALKQGDPCGAAMWVRHGKWWTSCEPALKSTHRLSSSPTPYDQSTKTSVRS
jgi:hypothetical protein